MGNGVVDVGVLGAASNGLRSRLGRGRVLGSSPSSWHGHSMGVSGVRE